MTFRASTVAGGSPVVRADGKAILERSAHRYLELLTTVAAPLPGV